MRYRGQDQTVKVRLSADLSPAALRKAFDTTYVERYGHVSPIRVQIVSLRVSCQAPLGAKLQADPAQKAGAAGAKPLTRDVYSIKAGAFVPYAIYDRDTMKAGDSASGPCLVEDHATTTNVPEGWIAKPLPEGSLELIRV
jgi:N-methylhydantoinase A/oxoprolinase/acetone carboxylase beta subunit